MGLMPYVRPKYLDNNSVLANGYQLFFYIAGTTTKQNTFSDTALTVANPNPIILNARGEPDNVGTPIDIYLTPGLSYKVVLATDTDTDPPASPVWTVDNVTDASGGGGAGSSGQWLTSDSAVYVNSTTFKLVGVDLTADYHKGRRVWLSGGANRWATIFISSFAIDTTVTLVDIQDSAGAAAVLDPVMTDSALSIQRVDADHAIHWRFYPGTDTGVTNFEFPVGDIRRYGAKMDGVNDDASFVSAVAAAPAGGTVLVPDGIAAINNKTFSKEVHIRGTGTLEQISANSDFLTFGAGSAGSSIQNLSIDGNQTPAVQFGTTIVINIDKIDLQDNHIFGGEDGIEVNGASATGANVHNNRIDTNRTTQVKVLGNASEVLVANNTVMDGDHGVFVEESSDVIVTGNNILNFLITGVRIVPDVTSTTPSEEIIVSNNYINNATSGAVSSDGIFVTSSHFVNIMNNNIDKIIGSAISADWNATSAAIPRGLTIVGNTIIEPTVTGLQLTRMDRGVISNNNLLTNNVSGRGIHLLTTITNSIISNNNIEQCTALEIDRGATETNVIFANNIANAIIYQSNMNIFALSGFSTSATRGENVYGTVTWPGAANASGIYTFPIAEPDTNYEVIPILNNTSALDGFVIKVTNKTTTGVGLITPTGFPAAGTQASFMILRVTTPHT